MVNFQQLKGITQSNAQTAQLQALQTAVAGELDTRAAKMRLLGEVIPSSLAFGDKLLNRRAEAKAAKAKQLALQGYNDAQIDLMLGSQLGGIGDPGYEGQAPLELKSYPLDEVADANRIQQTEPGKFSVGIDNGQAMATPGINPQIEASMRRIAKYGGLAGIPQGDIRASLAYSQYSPEGLKDRYSAEEAKSEYLSKEGLEGAGSKSRRNLDRDLDLSKNRADIANTYDTINKRVKGGSGADNKKQAAKTEEFKSVGRILTGMASELGDINHNSWFGSRIGSGIAANVGGGGELGAKVEGYEGTLEILGTAIARLYDTGAMSDRQVAAAKKAIPRPGDPVAKQQEKYRQLVNLLNEAAGEKLFDSSVDVTGRMRKRKQAESGNEDQDLDFEGYE